MQTSPLGEPKAPTILDSQISQIESRLKSLYELSARIGAAVDRLANPRPASAQQDQAATPVGVTIEGKLQNINRTLDSLIGQFADHAESLDKAI